MQSMTYGSPESVERFWHYWYLRSEWTRTTNGSPQKYGRALLAEGSFAAQPSIAPVS